MIGINYLAAVGTIFIMIGFYCFKPIVQKHIPTHGSKLKLSTRVVLFFSGLTSTILGVMLILKALNDI